MHSNCNHPHHLVSHPASAERPGAVLTADSRDGAISALLRAWSCSIFTHFEHFLPSLIRCQIELRRRFTRSVCPLRSWLIHDSCLLSKWQAALRAMFSPVQFFSKRSKNLKYERNIFENWSGRNLFLSVAHRCHTAWEPRKLVPRTAVHQDVFEGKFVNTLIKTNHRGYEGLYSFPLSCHSDWPDLHS